MSIENVHADARVEFRMAAALKHEVEDAAALLGITFTAFATQTLVSHARRVKEDHATTILNDAERNAFVTLFSSPPGQNPRLEKLLQTEVSL